MGQPVPMRTTARRRGGHLALESTGAILALSLVAACSAGGAWGSSAPSPTTTLAPVSAPRTVPTVAVAPSPTAGLTRVETSVIRVRFDTYETEETVGAELGKLPGVVGAVVTQTEITVTYNPEVVTLSAIVGTLAQNPEVRLENPGRP